MRDELAEALAYARRYWRIGQEPTTQRVLTVLADWVEQEAYTVERMIEAAKAEALREAAEAIGTDGGYIGGIQWGRTDYVGWLHDRAAALDPESQS